MSDVSTRELQFAVNAGAALGSTAGATVGAAVDVRVSPAAGAAVGADPAGASTGTVEVSAAVGSTAGAGTASPSALTVNAGDAVGEAVLEPALRPRARDEWARAKDTEGVVCQTHVGGQALIEGIMMRGKFNWAVAVREPSGNIYVEEHDLVSGKNKNGWMYKPVVRGCTAMVEALALGYKALDIASQHAFDLSEDEEAVEETLQDAEISATKDTDTEAVGAGKGTFSPSAVSGEAEESAVYALSDGAEVSLASAPGDGAEETPAPASALGDNAEEPPAPAPAPAPGDGAEVPPALAPAPSTEAEESAMPKALITGAMIVGLILGVVIFVVLPALLTNWMVGDYAEKTLLWNLVDGVLRVAIFVFYIWLIGRMKDIKRMFGYHGAEHKTIHCYEHGLELTVENARRFPTLHVRCGTAFMLTTMLIAILVFTLTPIGPLIDAMHVENEALRLVLVILSRIILLPVVAGLSYEVTVKWAGSRPKNPLVQIVLWPGMQMQRLTTNQPDDEMLECAIAAIKRVLEREDLESAKKRVETNPASAT